MANTPSKEEKPTAADLSGVDATGTAVAVAAAALVEVAAGAAATVEEIPDDKKNRNAAGNKTDDPGPKQSDSTATQANGDERIEGKEEPTQGTVADVNGNSAPVNGSPAPDNSKKGEAEDPVSKESEKEGEKTEDEGDRRKTAEKVSATKNTPGSAENPAFTSTGGRFKRTVAHKDAARLSGSKSGIVKRLPTSDKKPKAAPLPSRNPPSRNPTSASQARSQRKKTETKAPAAKSGRKRKATEQPTAKAEPKSKARKTSSTKAGGDAKEPFWEGTPDDDISIEGGWPEGWKKQIWVRKSGSSKGHKDSYWFSPLMQFKFRSMKGVKGFLRELKNCKGDERKAYKKADVR